MLNQVRFPRVLLLVSTLVVLLAAGAASINPRPLAAQPAESPWPMFRLDARHTGQSPYAGDTSGVLRWVFDTGKRDAQGGIENSPSIGPDGTVYVGGNDGIFYALDGGNGAIKWTYNTGLRVWGIFSSAAIGADGTIYFGSKRRFYALTPPAQPGGEAGVRWYFDVVDLQTSPVLGPDGTVYFGANDRQNYQGNGFVFAMRAPASGQQPIVIWTVKMGPVVSSPALGDDGTLYLGSFDGNFYALNAADGSIKWVYSFGVPAEVSPAIGPDNTVYTGANDGVFYAFDGASGALKWRFETRKATDGIFSSPAVGRDGRVYTGANDGYVYALDAATGALIWEFAAGLPVLASPAVDANGVVYVGADTGIFFALKDGAIVWGVPTTGALLSGAAIAPDGTVYFGSMDGKLYAVSSLPPTGPPPASDGGSPPAPEPSPSPLAQ